MPNRRTPRASQMSTTGSLRMSEPLTFKTAQRIQNNYHTHLEEEYANYRKPPDVADMQKPHSYGTRKHLDDFLHGRIIRRLVCGRTQLEVSEELGIAQSVIFRLWQRFQDDGYVSRCYRTGRHRVTTPNEDRYIYLAVTAKRNRQSTASDLSRQLSSATDTTVSRQTVYRRSGHIRLYARRPVRCVAHTATHCRQE
ncbi:transposable element Tcb2 transposase [Trichonephila clavipes]|nr:transposable element Tcb2 transposase [Trichonephila clavipes]